MYKVFFIVLMFWLALSCAQKLNLQPGETFKGLKRIDFCDLPQNTDELVYIRAAYSGIDEYWALNSVKPCKQPLNVDLDDRAGEKIPQRFQQQFDSAHNFYWNTYLIVDLVGVFENSERNGYGHLGSNKARLIVKEYVNVTLVRKQK